MRCVIDDPHRRAQEIYEICGNEVYSLYHTEVTNLYFTAVYNNDVELLGDIIGKLSSYPSDDIDDIEAEQTCFKYAVENDHFEIAKLLVENSKVRDEIWNVMRYIAIKENAPFLFLIVDEIFEVTDISNSIKMLMVDIFLSADPFFPCGKYSELLIHSGYLLMKAVDINCVPLAMKCLAMAPEKIDYHLGSYSCPLDLAISKRNSEMIRLLVRHGNFIGRTLSPRIIYKLQFLL